MYDLLLRMMTTSTTAALDVLDIILNTEHLFTTATAPTLTKNKKGFNNVMR
jgi:hypothetical protein